MFVDSPTTADPLSQLVEDWPHDSDWTDLLRPLMVSPPFQKLDQFVTGERSHYPVLPAASSVFQAFRLTPFANTRVVILGQDPYHGPGQAHGLSFSVPEGVPSPPSLKNIFRELSDDLKIPTPSSGDLSNWSRQGVLLLNTVLTVRAGQANSHAGQGWESFTDEVIRLLGQRQDRPVIFVLWGKPAERKKPLIQSRHPILCSPHPSPLSAYRGFFGSRPFSKINQLLESWNEPAICWTP